MGGRGSSSGGGGGGGLSAADAKAVAAGKITAAGEDRYKRLQGGATLHMQNPTNGVTFDVHVRKFAGTTGYVISQNGKAAKGYRGGMIRSHSDAAFWLSGLKEVT